MQLIGKIKGKFGNYVTLLAITLVLLYFFPCYLSAYDGARLISLNNIAIGKRADGYMLVESRWGFICMLLIPLAILTLSRFIQTGNRYIKYGLSGMLALVYVILLSRVFDDCAGIDLLDWMYNGHRSFFYFLEFAVAILLIIACVVACVFKADRTNLLSNIKNKDVQNLVGSITDTATKATATIKMSVGIKRVCQGCGAELAFDATFCPKCGTKYEAPEIKKCPKCGAIIRADDAFCTKCGTKYEKTVDNRITCPKCGAKMNESSLFCEKCGTKLTETNPVE